MKTQACPRCEDAWLDWATVQSEVDSLARRDPEAHPRHREATDAEWWAWVLEESGADQ